MRRLTLAAIAGLLAGFLFSAEACAQVHCPTSALVIPGNVYSIRTSDNCEWLIFSASGNIAVTLPTPSLFFSTEFTVTLIPLSTNSNFSLTVLPAPDTGAQGKVNNVTNLNLGVGQSVELRIGTGGNWYAQASGAGGGSGNVTGSGTAGNVAGWQTSTGLVDTGVPFSTLISGTKSGNTSTFATTTGTLTTNHTVIIDNAGNLKDAGGSGIGTVTSIDLSDPGGIFAHSGTPITVSGTATLSVTGNSGAVPYFSNSSTLSSSSLLGANQIVVGGGVGTAPATIGSSGTTTSVLHGNASGFPSFGAVNLQTDVTSTLPLANMSTMVNNTVLGNVSGITATPLALNATQLTTLCNAFTSTLSGCVIASGGGTTNYARADGTWSQPPQAVALGSGFTKTNGTDNATPASLAAGDSIFGQIVPKPKTGNYTVSLPTDNQHVFLANGSGSITFTLPQAVAGNQGEGVCFGDESAHGFALATSTSTFFGISGVSGSSASFQANSSVCAVSDGANSGNWALSGTQPPSTLTLTNTHMFVGNALNAPTDVAITGDWSVTNTGVVTNNKVNGATYPSAPSANTVPVVTSAASGGTITYEAVPNAALANSSITVNSTACTLGGSCTTGGGTLTSAHLYVGNGSNVATDTAITGDWSITNAGVVTNNKVNGVAYSASPSTNTVPVITGANTATYEAVPNAALANASTTVSGVTCTLGSTCKAGARVLISTQTASASANLAFTALPNYNVIEFECNNIVMATNSVDFDMIIGEGAGPTYNTTGYYTAFLYNNGTATAGTTNNDTSFKMTRSADVGNGRSSDSVFGVARISNIAASGNTKEIVTRTFHVDTSNSITDYQAMGGYYNDTVAITAVKFQASSGNITSGQCSAYGIAS